jgi:hypothetical protein
MGNVPIVQHLEIVEFRDEPGPPSPSIAAGAVVDLNPPPRPVVGFVLSEYPAAEWRTAWDQVGANNFARLPMTGRYVELLQPTTDVDQVRIDAKGFVDDANKRAIENRRR